MNGSRMRQYSACIIVLIFLGLIGAGCGSTKFDSSMQGSLDTLGLTANRVTLLNLERNTRLSLVIEAAADSIARLSPDRNVRQHAVRWKISAVPTVREALFSGDPAAGAMDAWAFTLQMQEYFQTGNGRDEFKEFQPIALRACAKMDSLLIGEQADSSGRAYLEAVRGNLLAWVRAHPIESSILDRRSVIPDLPALKIESPTSLGGVIGDIGQTVRDLSARVNIYAGQVPKEARWQVEYLGEGYRLAERLDTLERQATAVAEKVDGVLGLIERGKLVLEIESLKQLREDLLAIEETIARERELIMADVNRQRLETISAAEKLAENSMQIAERRGVTIVDHLMWRVAQILAVSASIAIVCLAAFWVLWRRRAP